MRLEDIKEQIQERAKESWIKIQESSAYISLRERYDNLTPNTQKLLRAFLGFFVVGVFFWFLWGLFQASSQRLTEFEDYQYTMQELAKLKIEMSMAPRINPPPPAPVLQQRVDSILQSSRLGPEQIDQVSVRDIAPNALIRPPGKKRGGKGKSGGVQQKGVLISLKSLNIEQIKNIAFQLQSIHNAVKLIGLDMKNSMGYTHYYDVMFTIVGFYPPPEPIGNNKKGLNTKKR